MRSLFPSNPGQDFSDRHFEFPQNGRPVSHIVDVTSADACHRCDSIVYGTMHIAATNGLVVVVYRRFVG